MKVELELLTNRTLYRRVMVDELQAACRSVLIATALVKQTRIETSEGITSFVSYVDRLLQRGVAVTVLFAGKPSRPFVASLTEYPQVIEKAVWRLCPRVHLKMVLVDDERLYLGSANLTGAGLGMKSANKRNFETGLFTQDRRVIESMLAVVRPILAGEPCGACGTKALCRREHEAFQLALQTSTGNAKRDSERDTGGSGRR